MTDNINRHDDDENSDLSFLISSAIKKKNSPPPPPSDNEASVNDIIKQAMAKKNSVMTSDGKIDYFKEAYSQPEASDDDLDAMIANAVSAKASGIKGASERFVTKADIYDNSADDYDEDEYVDDEDFDGDAEYEEEEFVPRRKKKKGFAAFFEKHKLKFIIAGLIVVVLLSAALLAGVIIFNHYFDRIGEANNSRVEYSIPDVDSEDTVSDVPEYENWLENQLRPYEDIMSSKDVYNVLLVGEDLRDTSEGSRGNTDVMMLVSINNETKTITLTSFMRDIYLYIPGEYSARLNRAYAIGGAELLGDTIEQNFGISIDNYVIVNFYTFIDIVEAIGGIEAEITQDMIYALEDPMKEQNMYLGNKWTQDLIKEPGVYNLNGNQALGYARIRHGVGDDYGRTQRQREVITKMIEKSRGMSLGEMKKLLDDVTSDDKIQWDLDKETVLSLLTNAYEYYKHYDIQDIRIPADHTFSEQRIRGMDVLCPDFDKNTELLQLAIYGKTLVKPESTSTTYYLPPSTGTTTYTTTTTTNTTTTTTTTTTSPTVTEPPTSSSSDISNSLSTPPSSVSSDISTTPSDTITTPSDTGSSYIDSSSTPSGDTSSSSSTETTPSVTTPSETTPSVTTPSVTTSPSDTTPLPAVS
ncbi:MAG: LCP family protein [Oscillospiraceae bacterium]|nr:LCP family protein [Oscillospiraceae bacterium]